MALKICETCSITFKADRDRTRFCSQACFGKYNRPKGSIPWNKGIKTRLVPANYKGENVSYSGLHHWVRSKLGSPETCVSCFGPAKEWANKSGEYKRDLNDWQAMCIPCHRKFDNVIKKSWATRKAKVC